MKDFSFYLDTIGEVGYTQKVTHPIVIADGLPSVKLHEIVMFESGQLGEVYAIDAQTIEILVFSQEPIKTRTRIVRTDNPLSVAVGKELLGKVIDPLGQPITNRADYIQPKETRQIDIPPLGIMARTRIKQPLNTGVSIVDMLIPIGKGQKELIIGDRKTGKSSFLLAAIKNQIQAGTVAIYAAIGRKKSDIKQLENEFEQEGIKENVIMVASNPYDAPSYIYLTPYTAMTIAEYFRDLGNDVLLVLDDLTTHAKFYREIALLARRFPGRDSYPGDIFYTHARLLERAGNYKHKEKGEVSITCFPVVETIEGDFTGYIATNLMSITDGHIYFDSNAYYQGRRPAVNVSLSVTRVGKQTQPKLKRDITRELNSFLSLYAKMESFSHFGAELTPSTNEVLKIGQRITKFFDQSQTLIVTEPIQMTLFALIWANVVTNDTSDEYHHLKELLTKAYQTEQTKRIIDDLISSDSFNHMLAKVVQNKDFFINLCNAKS